MGVITIAKNDSTQEYVNFNIALPSGNVGFNVQTSFRKIFKDHPEKVHQYLTNLYQLEATEPTQADNAFKGQISLEVLYQFTKNAKKPVHIVGFLNLRGRLTERNTAAEIKQHVAMVAKDLKKITVDDVTAAMTEDLAAELDAAEAA
jgi:hypothetical protein